MKNLNGIKSFLSCAALILMVGVLSGCHAAKGLGQDIKESTATAGEHLQATDAWLREHAW